MTKREGDIEGGDEGVKSLGRKKKGGGENDAGSAREWEREWERASDKYNITKMVKAIYGT